MRCVLSHLPYIVAFLYILAQDVVFFLKIVGASVVSGGNTQFIYTDNGKV